MKGISSPPPKISFVSRGDPNSYDWDENDFIMDEEWHDLDFSGIVPPGTIGVFLRCGINSDTVGDRIQFRTKGNDNTRNRIYLSLAIPSVFTRLDSILALDENRLAEYDVYGSPTTLDIVVAGWFV